MQYQTKLILPITLILLSLTIGCERETTSVGPLIGPSQDNIEILIIGPYTQTCQGFIEQTCLLEFNEESQQWEFFYEGIRGFDFEPGFIYRLKVSLHERDGGIQDVGRYEYRLVEVLSKEEASVDERPPRKPSTE
jgi:hypothetical protein